MNQINPYRRNCEVMRKFFAKPIFLITGIVFSICVIVNLILGLLIKQNIYFDFMTVASCIAFFMFYFTARSKKESVSFRVPTVMLDIVSIIGIVFSGLASAFCGFYTVLTIFTNIFSADSPAVDYHGYDAILASIAEGLHTAFLVIFPILTVISLLLLFYFIGMQRMCLSFKKSLSNIYLQRKGSVLFGIMSVVFVMLSIGAMFVYFIPFGYPLDIPAVITFLSPAINFICMAVLAFMYNSYIKRLVNSLETGKDEQITTAISKKSTKEQSPIKIWEQAEADNQLRQQATVTRTVEFTPQTVFGNNNTVGTETRQPEVYIPDSNMQNPYAKQSVPTSKRCSNCGKENPKNNLFCGNCGNRL